MFRKFFKKTISYALLTSVMFNNLISVQATQYHNSISHVDEHQIEDSLDSNTTVYAEIGSIFKVTIPKHIILDGTLKQGKYVINVEGDIAGTETINVIPDASVTLKSPNLKDVIAPISQDKISWNYQEILTDENINGNGSIDANEITAGSWNGNFNFNIKLEEDFTNIHMHAYKLSSTTATCEEDGIATYKCVCGNTYTEETLAKGHDYSQVKGKVEATCTTSGYGYSCCKDCGKENPDSNSIIRVEPLGHDFVEIITPATCDTVGYTSYSCKKCDYSYTADQIEALGHKYEIISSTKSDCNTKGSITYKCNNCELENTIETEIGEHTWNNGEIKSATCTEEGYTIYTCLICSETKIENQEEIKEHNYDDGIVTTPATCETYGEKIFTCHDCGYVKTEEIEMYGHMYYGDTYICSICGESIIWNFELNEETKTMKLLSMKDEYKETLTDIVIPSKVMIDDILYKIEFTNTTYDGLTRNEEGYMIPNNAQGPFVGNTTIETVHFEDGATLINNDMSCMFLSCYSLKSVTNIPDSVENMKMAFEYCTSLESVPELPTNVTNLTDTFKFCSGLTNVGTVIIPENVKVMAGAFHSCTNMYGTVNIYTTEINEVAPNNGNKPFMPCYRSFYNTGQNAPEKVKICVYKFKNKEAYENRTSDNFIIDDLSLYTDTYKNLYYGNNENIIYYFTNSTYTVRSDVKTNYPANASSTGNYVLKYFWNHK